MKLTSVTLKIVAIAAVVCAIPAIAQSQAAQPGAPVTNASPLSGLAAALSSVALPNAAPKPDAQQPVMGSGASANIVANTADLPQIPLPPATAPRFDQRSAQPAGNRVAEQVQSPVKQPARATAAKAGSVSAPLTPSPSIDTMLTKLAPQMDVRVGGKDDGGLHLSGTVGIVVMLGLLTLLPTLLLLMTGFTRILIVMNFLRQALGTQNSPPSHLVAALSLILTGFVMAPTLTKVNDTALQPWMNGKMDQTEMMKVAVVPFREFMLKHTRDHDLQVFIDMSAGPQPHNEDEIPLVTLVSAFATSELRTAFQIGFALFLPFIIVDIVVSSVLMSMGMFMLPPAMISLPFKLLLFVLVDGWTLVVQSLVTSFRV